MTDVDQLPYRAEYAKSGRASCKGCKTTIGKETLRLAAMVQSPLFDGKVPHWYHFACFFGKQRPKSVGDIHQFDSLRWNDQEKIREKINETANTLIANVKSGKKASKRAMNKAITSAFKDFKVEYAKSSRAMCRGCEIKLQKGEVRISKKDYESEGAKMYGGQDRWHHAECFAKLRNELSFFENGEILPGFETLKEEDKEIVKKALPKIDPPPDAVDGPSEPKKIKMEEVTTVKSEKDDGQSKELKKQNDAMFKYRDNLKQLKKKELDLLLDHNKQDIPTSLESKLNALADIMTFGALEKCDSCKNGQFIYRSGGYQCSGDSTEWSKCLRIVSDPKRKKFRVPEELTEKYKFLENYKPKIGLRILPDNKRTITSNSEEASTSGPKVERYTPLRDMTFFIIGKLSKNSEEVKKIVIKLGGSVLSKISDSITAVISTPKEVEKLGSKMAKAREFGLQVLPEEFLDVCEKDANAIDNIKKMAICDWGTDPEKRIQKSTVTKSKKSGSMFTKSMPSKVKLKLKGGSAVDPDSGLEDVAHVYTDHHGTVFNAILGLTDVQRGRNSYYKLQLLQSDGGKKYWLFRSWGRIGTTIGGHKKDSMEDLAAAKEAFYETYLDKTGNNFKDKEFIKKPNLMYPVDVDYGQQDTIKLSLHSNLPSSLHTSVQELVSMIFDVDKMKKVMMEFELDLEKMPLGKLSKNQIQKAYSVLAELQNRDGDIKPAVVIDASNRFYTLIPHSFGVDNPPLLDNKEIIQSKLEMLESLLEMELAYSLLQETQGEGSEEEHPLDSHYKKLNTEIEVVSKDEEEFEIIRKYVENTHGETHTNYKLEIDELFKVKRNGEDKRFKPFKKLHNRKLLWHGSRLTNFAGILSQGLRIAPPEAPVTGYMFGKGIYFADMVTKSANYCMTSPGNNTGLLLLCEVALGDMYERTRAEFITQLPKGKHSTKGVGITSPDPEEKHIFPDGLEVPYGKGIKNGDRQSTTLLYNEYIVYDVTQVKAKYLLKVNFKYNY